MTVQSSHDLAEEFPEHVERIRALVLVDAAFSHSVQDYVNANLEILRIENEIETGSDDYLEALKKKRLRLLDAIHSKLVPLRHTGT